MYNTQVQKNGRVWNQPVIISSLDRFNVFRLFNAYPILYYVYLLPTIFVRVIAYLSVNGSGLGKIPKKTRSVYKCT